VPKWLMRTASTRDALLPQRAARIKENIPAREWPTCRRVPSRSIHSAARREAAQVGCLVPGDLGSRAPGRVQSTNLLEMTSKLTRLKRLVIVTNVVTACRSTPGNIRGSECR
jgi:hypothetical protein